MNKIKGIGSIGVLMIVAAFFTNCGDDKGSDPAEKIQLDKLSKTWNIVSASLDGTVRTGDFTDFKLTISGTFNSNNPDGPYNFSVSGSRPTPSPWPGSGTWTFSSIGTGDTGTLLRNDDVSMIYTISSNGQLTLSFTCLSCNYAGARTEQVNGNWIFTFN